MGVFGNVAWESQGAATLFLTALPIGWALRASYVMLARSAEMLRGDKAPFCRMAVAPGAWASEDRRYRSVCPSSLAGHLFTEGNGDGAAQSAEVRRHGRSLRLSFPARGAAVTWCEMP